jgi:putative flavoprotein involved in K+ transport
MAERGPERIETVIIGGGQAGLSVGYHLARRGRPFLILDANQRLGDAWRNRWDSLRLFTSARYSGLEGMPFPAADFSFPTKDEMAEYLEAYVAPVPAAGADRGGRGPAVAGRRPVRGAGRRPALGGRQRGGGDGRLPAAAGA